MITTIILTFCVFASWLLIPHKITRYILGCLSILALLLMVIGVTANMTHHWGMKKQLVTSDKKEIFSAGPESSPTNILIANEIGKKTNNYIMVYRNHKTDSKAQVHFKPQMDKDKIADSVKHQTVYQLKHTNKATIQTKKEIWVWKSNFYKALLGFGQNNQELIKSTTTLTIPKDTWVVLNAEQSKKLQRLQEKHKKSDTQQNNAKTMQHLMVEYKKQHPNASANEINKYMEHQKEVIATKQIKKELSK
ncbi:DUF4811 domain-containing protein [Staphylococcus simiae]|uniref:DUF4811 domain-containing protein n=1 Tax=Staphylococcus simiae TaxID=308354 RepID=UPI001A9768B2|nr:DUF4811 domain-containing protein [Staphylococcus simiae]MBO1198401.1 DUF4811 domain-containing protein [Staphylococcus simiae]MBO1200595.1 DUF4811 domain-containing protein [Staphylococcus simiae]MBO1202866.1 DUF4811 domain-containing protein [Staphylococcus simiae]MBO1210393.1 DUF4811 domain-containing protein [Staphylococcus simiae]MBO1228932.1 DUF4811 domain-containing protein [Staphylococcus simiae]